MSCQQNKIKIKSKRYHTLSFNVKQEYRTHRCQIHTHIYNNGQYPKLAGKGKELLTLRNHMGSTPVYDRVRVALIFNFLCVLFCCVCLVSSDTPMLSVSLDFPFLFAPTVLSSVYLVQELRSNVPGIKQFYALTHPLLVK